MWRATLPALVLGLGASLPLPAQDTEENDPRGFVGSMASLVYGTAWPTATYEDWQLRKIERLEDGLALLVRLSGESGFGGNLWLDLVFEFRSGQFYDLRVVNHNAILMPPFKTAKAVAGLAADLAQEYNNRKPATPAPPRGPPIEARPTSRMLRTVSRCSKPIDLWLRYRGLDDRWTTLGVWSLTPNDASFLATGGDRLQLTSSVIYFYAEIPNTGYTWSGERAVSYGDRSLPMRTDTLPTTERGSYELLFTCTNVR